MPAASRCQPVSHAHTSRNRCRHSKAPLQPGEGLFVRSFVVFDAVPVGAIYRINHVDATLWLLSILGERAVQRQPSQRA